MKSLYSKIGLVLFSILPICVACAAENYGEVHLPKGVIVELPKNWYIMSESDMVTIAASSQSIGEKAGYYDASTDLAFGAGYIFAGESAALFNIRYYSEIELSQRDVASFTNSDVQEVDSVLEQGIKSSGNLAGFTVVRWLGTTQKEIKGVHVLITEYLRKTDGDTDSFRVRLVRVLDEEKSFTVTISYRDTLGGVLRPICDRVINSIRVDAHRASGESRVSQDHVFGGEEGVVRQVAENEESESNEEDMVIADFKFCRVTSNDTEVILSIAGGPLTDEQIKSFAGGIKNIQNLPISPNRVLLGQTILKPSDDYVNGFYLQTLMPLMARLDLDPTKTVEVNFLKEDGIVTFDFDVVVMNDAVTLLQLNSKNSPKGLLEFLYTRDQQTFFYFWDRSGIALMGRLFTDDTIKEAFAIGDKHLGSATFTQ
ncbi:MAG: hypothetical protein ACPGJU_02805 [Coraliomargarita sp.]